jgi:NADPH:quinone reductase-like Zn-dependent oxidoreductase
MTMTTVQVKRGELEQVRLVDGDLPPLAPGGVRLKVESFSVTANNVTYAVIGEAFGYWNFFPAPEGWGVVPMWGHAVVEASDHGEFQVGERVYGYLPMATHLDVVPGEVAAGSFTDMAAHRQPMSAIYNQYRRLSADPSHDPTREAQRMIFQPLFTTSFLIGAFFERENWFGADTLVVTSASSKTALALAFVARAASPSIRRVGLTSARNVDFVRASGLYDEVYDYDAVGPVGGMSAVLVDFAGNGPLLRSLHETLGEGLKYSCLVGATHVEARGGVRGAPLPGPEPILFFAPTHAQAAIAERGAAAFNADLARHWRDFVDATDSILAIDRRPGLQAAADAYLATLRGTAPADRGIVIEL